MKRIHRIGVITGCAGLVWVGMLCALQSTRHSTAVLLAPLAAVFGLAAYMLAQLVWGVVTFRSVPEAADALQRDLARIRRDLEARGFKFADADARR